MSLQRVSGLPITDTFFLNDYSQGYSPRHKEQLLESLNSGSPFTRVNHISNCSEGTFTWIFDAQSSDLSRPEVQLRKWLQQGEGIFWIIGKPGSGKSTLMKFVAGLDNQHDQTLECLETWAAPKKPCILSFYFWLADTSNTQNSFRGFLCSLLHQILEKQSLGFISCLKTVDRLRQKRQINNWDMEELETVVKDVARRVATQTPLCFFIDGLDECLPIDLDRVVKIIKELALHSDSEIKFCVSSRPEQKIENRLRALVAQSLKLHKLTQDDIRRHVTDEFENCWQGGARVSPTNKQKKQLIDELVWSSEGVFLWALLVARKLCGSIEMGDTIGQLWEQFEELPHDITKLYETMLKKSDGTNGNRKAEAASYFKFVIDHSRRDILHKARRGTAMIRCRRPAVANFVPLYERYHGKIDTNSASSIFEIVQHRIIFLCAGMVVIENDEVDFFHRTARDFFQEPSAKEILEQCRLTQLQRYCLFVDGVCRHRESDCVYGLNAHEAHEMLLWRDNMNESDEVDKLEYLKYVNQAISRAYAAKDGAINESWVYEQSRSHLGDDQVLDFLGLSFQIGSTEILSQYLSTKRGLSGRYKDYLLLCSPNLEWKTDGFNLTWRKRLLELGAQPNATFYWGLQDRLKTSPWLQYLANIQHWHYITPYGVDEEFFDNLDMDTVTILLDKGASLDDRTVLFKNLSRYRSSLDPVKLRVLSPRLSDDFSAGMFFAIEVNAKYLLEEQCRAQYLSENDRRARAEILSRPDVQESQSYRRILLIHPGYPGEDAPSESDSEDMEEEFLRKFHLKHFAEIDFNTSEKLLDKLVLVPHQRQIELPDQILECKEEEILDIWYRSPKVPDIRQYLEEKGYYKQADDPAVEQGPIPMFEDEE